MLLDDILYACIEHIDVAIDDYVNSKENAPEMMKVDGEKCSYCGNDAKYKIC